MAQTQRVNKVVINLSGGPSNEPANRSWRKDSRVVVDQITTLLEFLSFDGESVLFGVEARKGNSVNKDLRLQRPDPSGTTPGILFSAQPNGTDTCWIYRLCVPHDTDLGVLFGKMQMALEEGRHMATLEEEAVSSNVVQLNPQTSDKYKISDVLKDKVMMEYIFKEVFAKFQSSAMGKSITDVVLNRQVLQETILHHLGGAHTRNDSVTVMNTFLEQKLLKREPGSGDMIRLSKDGRKLVEGENEIKPKEVEIPVKAQNPPPVQQAISLDEQLTLLRTKATAYAEAEAKHATAKKHLEALAAEITNLEDRLAKKTEELRLAQTTVREFTVTLADPEFKRASEELKRLRQKYFG